MSEKSFLAWWLFVNLVLSIILIMGEYRLLEEKKEMTLNYLEENKQFFQNYYAFLINNAEDIEDLGGAYLPRRFIVFIREDEKIGEIIFRAYHEICHDIETKRLTEGQWAEYQQIYNLSYLKGKINLYTVKRYYGDKYYNGVEIEENFANACAKWLYYGDTNDEEKNNFMELYVKRLI